MQILKPNIFYHYPFSLKFLKENYDTINWDWVISNSNIDWSIEHLDLIEEKIKSKYRRNEILRNSKIASNQEIIFTKFERLNPKYFAENRYINWDEKLLGHLLKKVDLGFLSVNLNVGLEFLEEKKSEINWKSLSWNTKIEWTESFIELNKDLFDWKNLSLNPKLPWDNELISKFEKYWNWNNLCKNPKINWTESLIKQYSNQLNWEILSSNPNVNISVEFIEENKDQIDFRGLSRNLKIKWSNEFIKKRESQLVFGNYGLSWNTAIPWNEDLIEKYRNRWSWSGISSNFGIPWNEEIIDRFYENLIWGRNDNLDGDSADASHRRNGFCLSNNPNLPWTSEFIRKHENRWSSLATNSGIWEKVLKPTLTEEKVKDIIEYKE